ncbi:hypothetical protein FS837_004659 [Tulasnella sp. UAMH 9824]|nr:hypothetical protein FS837_004659 [Tulasnella sp. UAMH 9824]
MDFSSGGTPGLQGQQLARPSIHDLPIELLSHIISLSVQKYSANITRTQNLCLVCSRWQDVVEGTPELWARITSADPLRGVRKAIDCSRDYPLDIDYGDVSHPNRSGPDEFLSAVSLDAWRWGRVSIICRGHEDLLQRWMARKAPRLESLTITVTSQVPAPLVLFEGAPLPCLRTLHLRNVPIVWEGQQLFNLQKLEILAERQILPTLSSVLSVLRETQRLEDFVYVGHLFRTPGDETFAQESILLPALKKLRIHSHPKLCWLGLSRAIRAPACQHASLGGRLPGNLHDTNDLAQMNEGISHFLPRLRARGEWGERVHITIGSPTVTFRSSTLRLDFAHYNGTRTIQLTQWMILNLVDELVEIALDVNDPTWNVAQLEMLDLPTLRRTVSTLNIGPIVWQPRGILEHLSSPISGLDGQTRWPLPNLTELAALVNADDLAVILRVLRCRAQAIDLPGSARPQTLIELRLTEYPIGFPDYTERISEIDNFMRGHGGSLKIVPWGG